MIHQNGDFLKEEEIYLKNLDCALRELEEETTITNNQIEILNKINCVNEKYTGSNNINYKHIYYLGYVDEKRSY